MDQDTTTNHARNFIPAPRQLFDKRAANTNWGTFIGQVDSANIIDCPNMYQYKDLDNYKIKNNKRLKEWQAFQLSDNQKFICGALYQAKQFAVVAISYYDRLTEQHYLYKKFVRPSQLTIADGSLPSESFYHHNGIEFSIKRDARAEKTIVKVRWPKQRKLPSLELDLVLTETSPGMTICQPFSNLDKEKENRPLYSYKNLMPARSIVTLANTIVSLKENSVGILDDHKGFYPRYVNYDWGTAGAYVDNKLVGFNLTRNQIRNPEQYNENCLWYDGHLIALPAIEVTHLDNAWHYKDQHGLVDMMFTPQVNNKQKFHLGFVYMDYQGPFGLFNGHITHPQHGKIVINDMLGMAERKRYKL